MDDQKYRASVQRADMSLQEAEQKIADARRRLAAADRKYNQDVIKRSEAQGKPQ